MESGLTYHQTRALLEWQIDLGATEAICESPLNRYELPKAKPTPKKAAEPAPPEPATPSIDAVAVAQQAAAGAQTLEDLREAIANFDLCDLKRGARNLVFADGAADARVMIIGEAPGADEDRKGLPFVGRAGQLLDAMIAAISHSRAPENDTESPVYITNIIPWRPPQNRDPSPEEIAMMMPFVHRHIELVAPDVLVLMGNIACQALLGRKGVTRLRGNWTEAAGRPCMPMFHPAYLLRNPIAKRDAWHDLLMLQAKVRSL